MEGGPSAGPRRPSSYVETVVDGPSARRSAGVEATHLSRSGTFAEVGPVSLDPRLLRGHLSTVYPCLMVSDVSLGLSVCLRTIELYTSTRPSFSTTNRFVYLSVLLVL